MLLDARSVTALRTGAVAAVAARALAGDSRSVGVIGCGLHGAWAARCLAAAGYGAGVCHDPDPAAAQRLAVELGWSTGSRAQALGAGVVCCVTPGARPVVEAGDLRPGLHLNMLGADGPGKAEATAAAVASCALFCDEWEQAAHGGELTGAVQRRAGDARARHRAGRRAGRRRARAPGPRRGHAVRLHRPGDPGPGRGRRGLGGVARREGAGADGRL